MAIAIQKKNIALVGTDRFTSEEVSQRTGINYRTLMRFVERGLLQPGKVKPNCEKIAFEWTKESVTWGKIVSALWDYRFTEKRLKEIIEHLRSNEYATLFSENVFNETYFLLAEREEGREIKILNGEKLFDIPTFLRRGCVIVPIEFENKMSPTLCESDSFLI